MTGDGVVALDPVMSPFTDSGLRRFVSDADLLLVAQGGLWEALDASRFASVPEAGAPTLLGIGLAGLTVRRRAVR
jgi:hypothetical protein